LNHKSKPCHVSTPLKCVTGEPEVWGEENENEEGCDQASTRGVMGQLMKKGLFRERAYSVFLVM